MKFERFDDVAKNLVEVVDAILVTDRPQARCIKLIRHHVRHAISHGYRVGRRQMEEEQED
jgi:hypothetical protein